MMYSPLLPTGNSLKTSSSSNFCCSLTLAVFHLASFLRTVPSRALHIYLLEVKRNCPCLSWWTPAPECVAAGDRFAG
jgi:hypothetical protein